MIRSLYRNAIILPMVGTLAFSAAPRIFYSDLDSGPNTGGENNQGAYVTIYGNGFGSSRGGAFVTLGGEMAARYPVWTDTKIAFQLGRAARTGSIILNTGSAVSNAVPFTVRPGNIYFVAKTGNDSDTGGVDAPWRTVTYARDMVAPGDIVYVRDGVATDQDDASGWNGCLVIGANSGSSGNPKALVVYPGESAVIGNIKDSASGGCDIGIRTKGYGEHYWTIAGFTLRGVSEAILTYGDNGWRIIANDISCPNGNDQAGCLLEHAGDSIYIYGNNIHHIGTNIAPGNVTALYHGVYLSDTTTNVQFGWNTIAYVHGCRGLQQNVNSPASDAWGLHIHDNIIHDTQCDGIVMTTVNPAQGTVELYNNIIYNAGQGPNNLEATGAWTCMNLQGWDSTSAVGSGAVEVYNNTMYGCGTFANPPYLGANAGLLWFAGGNAKKYLNIRDNIVYIRAGLPYILIYDVNGNLCADSSNCSYSRGSNNLFYGNGPAPGNTNISGSVSADPLFINAAAADFHLSPGSPAAYNGVMTPDATDFDGVVLTTSPGYPIGAFSGGTDTNQAISISIAPVFAVLTPTGFQQFTTPVTGASNPAVVWSLPESVGYLSSSGLYIAPPFVPAPVAIRVVATSVADPSVSASAYVVLLPALP